MSEPGCKVKLFPVFRERDFCSTDVSVAAIHFGSPLSMAKKAPNVIDKHVGSRFRMKRILLGYSQEKLGEALGITFQQVQKYEKGTNKIGAGRLQQIAKILQAPPSFFFEGAPLAESTGVEGFAESPSSQYIVDSISSVEGLQLNRAFASVKNAKVRRRIVELVAAIAESSDAVDVPTGSILGLSGHQSCSI